MNNETKIKNMKINRVIFFITGIIFLWLCTFYAPFSLVGIFLLFLAYKTNKAYKKALGAAVEPEPVKEPEPEKITPVRETVKVTDTDGSVMEVSIHLTLDQANRVLVAEGGKTYHTHLSCFKKWRPEMTENFTGWKIIKKSEATANNMKYCSFCKELDNVLDVDMDDLDEYESEYEEE